MSESDAVRAVAAFVRDSDISAAVREAHLLGNGAVADLEQQLRLFYGCGHALGVSNATSGLLAVGLALDLQNAEFIAPAYTYGASLAGWLALGNRPKFVDIDSHTLTLDPAAAGRAITSKTRAILAVDMFGNPADSEALRQLADEYGLWYVADAAQSLGAFRASRPASAFAHVVVTSFTVGKSICAGEGGAVVTDNGLVQRRLVWHTQHQARQRRDLGLRLTNEFALNARMHPLAAIWASRTFESSLCELQRRQRVGLALASVLNETGMTEPIGFEWANIRPAFFKFTAALRKRSGSPELEKALMHRGFAVRVMQAPVIPAYRQAAFVQRFGSKRARLLPRTEHAFRHRVEICLGDLGNSAPAGSRQA